jgi:hypothetical protein
VVEDSEEEPSDRHQSKSPAGGSTPLEGATDDDEYTGQAAAGSRLAGLAKAFATDPGQDGSLRMALAAANVRCVIKSTCTRLYLSFMANRWLCSRVSLPLDGPKQVRLGEH